MYNRIKISKRHLHCCVLRPTLLHKENYSPTFNVSDVCVPGTVTLMVLEILAASKHKSSVLVVEIVSVSLFFLGLLVALSCPSTSIPTKYIKSPLASSVAIGFHDSVTDGV